MDSNKLPDFYSVRNIEQINYSFEGMEKKKCFCFFDNGFSSNIIEPNKRDIKFIWDGFILFVDDDITLDDIRNGISLYDARLVALQRTSVRGDKANNNDVRKYILELLQKMEIETIVLGDENKVDGYPSKCDLWSTRDSSVLLDAIDCVGDGDAFYVKNADFKYEINFNESHLPTLSYSHHGALILHGQNDSAIVRLICNDQQLQNTLERMIGTEKLYSYLEGRELSGKPIQEIKKVVRKG